MSGNANANGNGNYFLPEGYVERLGAPQTYDLGGDDTWQDEVYQAAYGIAEVLTMLKKPPTITILDWGCGSAFKLLKYFKDFATIGVDLAPAIERLRREHPDRTWCTPEEILLMMGMGMGMGMSRPDLVICSDVLEHLDNPDQLCHLLKALRPRWMVISTPDRELLANSPRWSKRCGPPGNGCHVREWAFGEFRQYIDSHFQEDFHVVRHYHSNLAQGTQCVLATIKSDKEKEKEKEKESLCRS